MPKTDRLSHERLIEVLSYDPDTGDFFWKIRKGRLSAGSIAGTIKDNGYRQIAVDGVIYLCQRLAWFYMTRNWPFPTCDHRNRIKTDNRFANLREATHDQNMRNVVLSSPSQTGATGVYFEARTGRYYAQIRIGGGKRKALGTFDTIEEASAARELATAEYHGEFAPR